MWFKKMSIMSAGISNLNSSADNNSVTRELVASEDFINKNDNILITNDDFSIENARFVIDVVH